MTILELVAALGGLTGIAAIVSAILSGRTTARQAEVSSLVLTIETLQTTLEAFEAENRRLREYVDALEAGEQAGRAEIVELRAQVEHFTDENSRLEQRIADLGAENKTLRAHVGRGGEVVSQRVAVRSG